MFKAPKLKILKHLDKIHRKFPKEKSILKFSSQKLIMLDTISCLGPISLGLSGLSRHPIISMADAS